MPICPEGSGMPTMRPQTGSPGQRSQGSCSLATAVDFKFSLLDPFIRF